MKRYPVLPDELVSWLSSVDTCHRSDESAWFLTRSDYHGQSAGFRWNEYEHMAIEAAQGAEEREEIARFWNSHFPIALAVDSDYDYLAIDLGSNHGAVVYGFAPEWESPEVICESVAVFLEALQREATQSEPKYPYSIFLGAQT